MSSQKRSRAASQRFGKSPIPHTQQQQPESSSSGLSDALRGLNEHNLKHRYKSLQVEKERVSLDLKEHVYNNYKEFIAISKEISGIEMELPKFRQMFSECLETVRELEDTKLSFSLPTKSSQYGDTSHVQIQEDTKWATGRLLDLEILISLRRSEEALTLIEKIEQQIGNEVSPPPAFVGPRVVQLKHRLMLSLITDLPNPNLTKTESRHIVSLLLRLGYCDRAKQVFLKSRSTFIRQEVRKIKFEGDVVRYIANMTEIIAYALRATLDDFNGAFLDSPTDESSKSAASVSTSVSSVPASSSSSSSNSALMSSFFAWTISELDSFVTVFNRQVFSSNSFGTIASCLDVVSQKFRKLAETSGLSLLFHFHASFRDPLINALKDDLAKAESDLLRSASEDSWKIVEKSVSKKHVKVSKSGQMTYASLISVVSTLKQLSTISVPSFLELYTPAVAGIAHLLSIYFKACIDQLPKLRDAQRLALCTNSHFICDDLIPRTAAEFKKVFGRSIPEMSVLCSFQREQLADMIDETCMVIAQRFWGDAGGWVPSSSSSSSKNEEEMSPSPIVLSLFKFLSALPFGYDIEAVFISSIISSFLRPLEGKTCSTWKGILVGEFDVNWTTQFAFDIVFVTFASGKYLQNELARNCKKYSDLLNDLMMERKMSVSTDGMERRVKDLLVSVPSVAEGGVRMQKPGGNTTNSSPSKRSFSKGRTRSSSRGSSVQ